MKKHNIILKNKIQELAKQLDIIISDDLLDSFPDLKLRRYKSFIESIIRSNNKKIIDLRKRLTEDQKILERFNNQKRKEDRIAKLAKMGFKQNHIAKKFRVTPARVNQIIINNK